MDYVAMYKLFVKRLLDILFSILLLPLFIISLFILAPAIYLSDKGPVFFNSIRRGKDGKRFEMHKYRSMKANAPMIKNPDGSTFCSEDDARITKIGHFLRKSSLDELPQIINILKGDMSFIGPRPTLANKDYDELDDVRKKGISVKPGITGYSQAFFRNSISSQQKYENDAYYVDNMSFRFDCKIFLQTIISVFSRKNIY
ncbi:MAG TPA: sugar transferase [Bacillota bacterium]|jgi:lipopolysaccharide/colanic/teichoic acid biosynthesis glycosyltransferase|nr:sugar transferase [Bacillota bacterium]